MNTLEISKKIMLMCERKDILERMKSDVSDYYTSDVSFNVDMKTTKFNQIYKGEQVVIDKQSFTNFLHDEIERLNSEIRGLINKLKTEVNK